MAPFNIRIKPEEQFVSFTILPTDKGYYKIVYYGAILAAIEQVDNDWRVLPLENIEAGDLPFYQHTADNDRSELKLDKSFTNLVGSAIKAELATQD